jgi:type IV secretory pathway VirD2 relaxase
MRDEFEPKLGKIGHGRRMRETPYLRKVLNASYKNGFSAKRKSSFTGKYIGRGSAMGALAAAGFFPKGQRRVLVKVRIAKLRAGDLSAPRAHLRYIQRDGVTRDGEPGHVYAKDLDIADGSEFTERCDGDRHQFRIIVSPEDATQMEDLKPFVRDFMTRMERDLGTELDWVAVDHYNTGHPHSHLVIRGKDDLGKDLIMTRDNVSHGIRHQAQDLVTLELGPEIDFDRQLKMAREVDAERFTRLDRTLLNQAQDNFIAVSAMPPTDTMTHAAQMGRLRKLQSYGLAEERQTGVWELSPSTENRLRALGQRLDIISTMHRSMREAGIDRPAGSFAVYHGGKSVVGRVAATGLADELTDRRYVVIDGADGKVHYADIGTIKPELMPERGMIASLEGSRNEETKRQSNRIRILSYLNLEKLVETQGATWLDKELLSRQPAEHSTQGFGGDVRDAITRRRAWLVSQNLARFDDQGNFETRRKLLAELRTREFQQTVTALSKQLDMPYSELGEGERISGVYRQPLHLASGKYAVIEKAHEFTLVPWRPEIERFRNKNISIVTGAGHEWELTSGRRLGLGL